MLGRYPYVVKGEGYWPALEKFLGGRRWEDEPNAEQPVVSQSKTAGNLDVIANYQFGQGAK